MNKLFPKKWQRIAASVVATIIAVYALIYVDVVMRARSAYLEGEKFWAWHENPQLKEKFFDEKLSKEKTSLQKKLDSKKISQKEYEIQTEIIEFNNKREREESSIKYAYVWYQTAAELFSPPESKWVRRSREKMPKAKQLWREELIKKGIPFEEYMLE